MQDKVLMVTSDIWREHMSVVLGITIIINSNVIGYLILLYLGKGRELETRNTVMQVRVSHDA